MAFTTGAKGDALLPISPKTIRTTDAAPLRREREAMFLEVNFRCYLTHSICGSKIIVNFPVVYNEAFFTLSGVAHRCASWRASQDERREGIPLCLAALGPIGRILLQLRAKPIAICKV